MNVRGNSGAIALVAVIVILTAIISFMEIAKSRFATDLDPRDPRCDTGARYEAMREGADCS